MIRRLLYLFGASAAFWLLVFYLFTLALEMALLLAGRPPAKA